VYKLRPKQVQVVKMDNWLDMLRANYNWSLADRIDTYQQRFNRGEYCDLKTKSVAVPLTCCVSNYGASGEPWRDNGKRRSAGEIQITALPELKKVRPWYKDIDSTVLQQNIKRLDKAFENFFVGRGFPKFKNRSTMRSFTFTTGLKLDKNKIYLPKLGWMRFYNSRNIPEGFKIKSATVRKKADGYYVSIRIEDTSVPIFPVKTNSEINTVVGLDMGLGKLIYCSDGSVIDNPRFGTNKKTKRLQRIRQRRVSRKKKRSGNRRKAQQKLSIFQHRIATKRESYQWQVAKKIVKKADAIAVEDLNISGMMKRCKPKYDQTKGRFLPNGQSAKRALSRSIADASWYALISKIEYMASLSGKVVLKINPRHTSQTCSACGHVDADSRDGEKFICTNCGHVDDANLQAARNIKVKAVNQYGLILKQIRKVRQDLSKPKQLSLFETPNPESTGSKRRQHHAQSSKRGVPGNLGTQLDLFFQDNNNGTIVEVVNLLTL
ncbi:transposase, partial [Fischerella thermalis WC542]